MSAWLEEITTATLIKGIVPEEPVGQPLFERIAQTFRNGQRPAADVYRIRGAALADSPSAIHEIQQSSMQTLHGHNMGS